MAKSGTSSSVAGRDSSRSAGTRARLIEAAIETLKAEGFAGSSARAIAERAGVNQGLIFYHFDSVANLLLAALDSVSARRMEHYGAAIDGVGSPTELVDVATAIFREDLDAGYVAVLVEMIAGASSTPGLGPAVSARLGPWFAFAERAVTTTFGPPLDVGRAAGRRGLRDRGPVSRARDADPPRRRSCQSARSLRPRQESGRSAGGARPAGGNEATMTGIVSSEVPRQQAVRPTRDSTWSPGPSATPVPPWPVPCSQSGRQVRTLTGHPGRAPATTADRRAAARLRRSPGSGGVALGGDDALQHLLGALRPSHASITTWPSPTRGRSSTPPSGRGSSGSCTSASRTPAAARRCRISGARRSWSGPSPRATSRTRSFAQPSSSAVTASFSTTSPGSSAGSPSLRSAVEATTGSGASTSMTWRTSV